MSLGSNIRKAREEREMTQEQVADKMGVTFQAVSSWERDEYRPDTDKLIRLAGLFDVSVSSLVEDRTGLFKTNSYLFCIFHCKSHRTFCIMTAKRTRL